MQEQPYRLLLVLLETPGEVVSREELRSRLWSGDTFVDFDGSLRVAVRKLREALDDNAEDPRYIETLPKRGYRFLVPEVRRTDAPPEIAEPNDDLERLKTHASAVATRQSHKSLLKYGIAAVAVFILTTGGVFFWQQRTQAKSLTDKDVLVLADFANLTGDPVFDNALRRGLEVQLEQSPYLNLLSEDRIHHTLRLMDQPPGTQVTGQVAREVCVRTGTSAVLEGSIQNVGTRYVLNLRATNCHTGNVLDQEQTQVASKDEVLEAITRMARDFRKRVGESRTTLQKHNVPLAEATTASIEALKSYSLGLEAAASKTEGASIPYFKHAVELDPKFAMAYAYLGLMYGSSGSSELATLNIRKAYELADRVSENERFFISAYYYGRAAGNQEKARQICEEWAETYPGDPIPHAFLAGFIYPALANYDKAIEEARKGMEIAPDKGFFYVFLGANSLYAGRPTGSEEALRRASERELETVKLLLVQYDLAFLKDDRGGMQQAVKAAQGKPDSMDWMADRQAFSLAYAGQLQKARVLSRQATQLAQQQGDRERAAQFTVRSALWEAFFGNVREAKQGAASALGLVSNREVEYGAAIVSGLAGDSRQAQALADHLESGFPEDTSIRFSYLPVIHAILALNRGDPAGAIHALEAAIPYELGSPRCAVVGFYGSLYPILFRGEAYLAAGKGPEAAREYQRLIDHRGIMIGDPVSVLARYGLARSYALSGDASNARSQYKEFLALWKEADLDLPVLQKARAELTELH